MSERKQPAEAFTSKLTKAPGSTRHPLEPGPTHQPNPVLVPFSVRIDEDLRYRIKEAALQDRISVQEAATQALRAWLASR